MRINYAQDPGFESGAVVYGDRDKHANVTSGTQLVTGDHALDGDYSLRIEALANTSGLTNDRLLLVGQKVATKPGEVWSASAVVARVTAGLTGRVGLQFWDEADVRLATTTEASAVGQKRPVVVKVEGVEAPPDAKWAIPHLALYAGEVADQLGKAIFDLLCYEKAAVAGPYFDGDQPGSGWTGARFYSPSAELAEPASYARHRTWLPPSHLAPASPV